MVFLVLASLDNSARTVFPPLYAVMARGLNVTEAALGAVTATSILVVALASVLWGYGGDRGPRGSRKRLLLIGTIVWSSATLWTALAPSYTQVYLSQAVKAVGIAAIGVVGYSVITDLVSANRRALMLSVWGVSQGVGGGGGGAFLASTVGAYNWRLPFMIIAGAGFVFALLFLLAYEPRRGQMEPQIAGSIAAGRDYTYRIHFRDLRDLLRVRTNVWLLLQGLIVTVGLGAQIWLPRLFISRIEVLGYGLETATVVGNFISLIFQVGVYGAILGGWLGDRWQRRNLRARAWIGAIGLLGAIPFQVALYFLPIRSLTLTAAGDATSAGILQTVGETFIAVFSNGSLVLAFGLALISVVLLTLDAPNRAALFAEVNPPEHRATIIGIGALLGGIGLSLGNYLAGVTFVFLEAQLPPPLNYAWGLAVFQLFLIPAGLCYLMAARSTPTDIIAVRDLLDARGRLLAEGEGLTDVVPTAAHNG